MNSSELKQEHDKIEIFEWDEDKVVTFPMEVSLETDIVYL